MKMKQRFVVLCGATLGLLLIAIGFAVATRQVKISLPGVAGYPETTMIFRVGQFGGERAIVRVESVQFSSPGWAAKLTDGRWKRSAGGTYVAFTCDPNSAACMKATNGMGSYRYVLYPFTTVAPSKPGQYSFNWDVQPPGDTLEDNVVQDVTTVVPEPASMLMIASGAAVLGGSLLRARRRQRK
jgi:PEP-CTERM motif